MGHAMMVDRKTLDRPRGAGVVAQLAAGGVAVLCVDLRGHGESGPRASDGGDWTYDDLVADVPLFLDEARRRFPGLPLSAVGHSLFGHVTLAHLSRHPETALDGLVMLAGNVCNPSWRRHPIGWAQKAALVEVMHGLTRVYGRLPVERLRFGSDDESPSYVDDFTRMARRAVWRARDGFDYYAALDRVRTPVFALVGAGDRLMAPERDVRGLLHRVPRAILEVVGRGSGLPYDPGHMDLVLDPRCQPVWERARRFVLQPR
ncbi:MAG TPA: alpha/beta fold hydrolase [Kofleriaceae bacterium]|nr:alpha/beta fold hydrolase [Kofleriaceae bacterium]